MSEIHGTYAEPARHYPRRILVAVAAVAIAGIFAAAAYAGYALTRTAKPVVTIGCYETDSLDANTSVLRAGKQSPVTACAGVYASAFPASQRPSGFAACVLPSGSIGVFPSDSSSDACKSLGLSDAPRGEPTP